ncbi:MAG: Hvo_1808 family surface protein [Halobacteria archaeon]|nr:Hvo_1808 family surface protein [Halobacteria archaeon]
MKKHLTLAVVVLLFTVPLGTAVAAPSDTAVESSVLKDEVTREQQAPPDPENDTIGWENGYWYNESINVDQSDGLSDAEQKAFVARSMARVEKLRQREFKKPVPVDVMTRAEYRNFTKSQGNTSANHSAWNNQVWEALFIADENTNITKELQQTYGEAVAGFYSQRKDSIVIVTDDPDMATIDNATLIHELVHALQDQYINLSRKKFQGDTQDEQLAIQGLIEGEANYVQRLYEQKCSSGEWTCVKAPSSRGGGGDVNLGILVTLLTPYSDGPVYIHTVVQNQGWEGLNQLYEDPPNTTEAIIHDQHPADPLAPLSFNDTARNGWKLFPDQGVNGYDRAGEASIYSMFWYQSHPRGYNIPIINVQTFFNTVSEFDLYNYRSTPSNGWGNDRIYPYHKNGSYGYVWVTVWDTQQDASEFQSAYIDTLRGHGAEQRGKNTWVIPGGGYEDAFHVVKDGKEVMIVNAPTVDDLKDIKPGIQIQETNGSDGSDGSDGTGTGDGSDGNSDTGNEWERR